MNMAADLKTYKYGYKSVKFVCISMHKYKWVGFVQIFDLVVTESHPQQVLRALTELTISHSIASNHTHHLMV